MSRFQFFESEMLASDLNRLLQISDSDSLSEAIDLKLVKSEAECFPGTILLHDNRPCAAIGYTREPGGTVTISEPVVLLNTSDEICQTICNELLKHVKKQAAVTGMQRLHFLQRESAEAAKFASKLTALGFVHATDILQWELSSEQRQFSRPEKCGFELRDVSAIAVTESRQLQSALETILECSDDLRHQPLPSAAELLGRWEQMKASVFVCYFEQRIAGLIACAAQSFRKAKSGAAESRSEANLCIEYIGVVPEFRRQKIASSMMDHVSFPPNFDDNTSHDRVSSQTLRVSAYSDSANLPAKGLYVRCGFTQTARMPLWCCDFAASGRNGSDECPGPGSGGRSERGRTT